MKEDDRWIVVRNWERFQHPDVLRTERPAWVKTHTNLLTDDDFLELSDRRRGLLVCLWLLYASAHGRVAVNTRRLSHLLSMRITSADLEALNHAGFIKFCASKPASTHASKVASLEESREEEVPKGQAVKGLVGSSSTQDRNGLPEEPHYSLGLEIEVAQIMAGTTDQDEGSEQIVRRYAEQLPLGAIAKVRESAHGKHVRYAVAALKDELRERGKL